jgi:O-antigen ligase
MAAVTFVHPMSGIAMIAVLMLVPLLQVGMNLAVDTRYLAMPLIAVVAVRSMVGGHAADANRASHIDEGGRPVPRTPQLSTVLAWALPAMTLFALLSLSWTIDRTQTSEAALALVAGSVLIFAVRQTVGADRLVQMLAVVASLVIVVSLVALVVAPGTSFLAMRARGVFFNANGFAAFLVVSTPLILVHLRRARWLVAVVLLALVALTASRSGTAAVVLELVIFLIATRRPGMRLPIGVGITVFLGLAFSVLRQWTDSGLLPLLRSNNSRASEWAGALALWREHPILGVGVSASATNAAGLFPYLLAATGLVGTILASSFIIVAGVRALRAGPMYMALVGGSLVNVVFEPWLFTAGSLYCLMFWLVVSHPGSASYGLAPGPEHPPSTTRARRSAAPSLGYVSAQNV